MQPSNLSSKLRNAPRPTNCWPGVWPKPKGWQLSLVFQSISPGNYLEFAADGFLDRNDRMHLEYESRKHRTEFVNGHRIVTFHQHMPTPLTDSYYEEFNLEIGGRLPLTEYLKDSLLGILVFHGRALRAFEPADHVLHRHPPNGLGPQHDCCYF